MTVLGDGVYPDGEVQHTYSKLLTQFQGSLLMGNDAPHSSGRESFPAILGGSCHPEALRAPDPPFPSLVKRSWSFRGACSSVRGRADMGKR